METIAVDDTQNFGILKDYAPSGAVAQETGTTERALRERRRKRLPPDGWVKTGRIVHYHIPTFRQWLENSQHQPVRSANRSGGQRLGARV